MSGRDFGSTSDTTATSKTERQLSVSIVSKSGARNGDFGRMLQIAEKRSEKDVKSASIPTNNVNKGANNKESTTITVHDSTNSKPQVVQLEYEGNDNVLDDAVEMMDMVESFVPDTSGFTDVVDSSRLEGDVFGDDTDLGKVGLLMEDGEISKEKEVELPQIDLGATLGDEVDLNITGEASVTDNVAHLTGNSDAALQPTVPVVQEVADIADDIGVDHETEKKLDLVPEALTEEVASNHVMAMQQVFGNVSQNINVAQKIRSAVDITTPVVAANNVGVIASGAGADISDHSQEVDHRDSGHSLAKGINILPVDITLDNIENLEQQGFKFAAELREVMQPMASNVILGAASITDAGVRVYILEVKEGVSPDIHTVAEQVRVAMIAARTEGQHNFNIQLAPKNLGLIEVQMEVVGDRVTVIKMLCNRPETRDMLMKESGILRLEVGKVIDTEGASLSFDLRSSDQHQQFYNDENSSGNMSSGGDNIVSTRASDSYEKRNDVSSDHVIITDDSVNIQV